MSGRVTWWCLSTALMCLPAAVWAQESSGEAEIGFQQYSLDTGGSTDSTYGLSVRLRQLLPNIGTLTLELAPASSGSRFRAGQSYVELRRFPWLGNYWVFHAGDFRLPGQALTSPFNNLYFPEIGGRGGWVEASHGNRSVSLFFGSATLQAGLRVPYRLTSPQRMAGLQVRQQVGERLKLGARVLGLTTDLSQLRETTGLALPAHPYRSSLSMTVDALYTVSSRWKWFGEASVSRVVAETGSGSAGGPFSVVTGPLFDGPRLSFRVNYLRQSSSYFPLLGYYLGDRSGPFGEVKYQLTPRVTLYGSASRYANNVAGDPYAADYRARSQTAGTSIQLPGRLSLSAQWAGIRLSSRQSARAPWEASSSEQRNVVLSRPFGIHAIRFTLRDLRQETARGRAGQRAVEVGDSVRFRWFTAGGDLRVQRASGAEARTSLLARGTGQFSWRRLSAFANVESGTDMANRTLFATSTVRSTVVGGSMRLGPDWNVNAEAFRNSLVSNLNPGSIFVYQGQGVAVPSVLSAFNQWSFYLRVDKRLRWGEPMPAGAGESGGPGASGVSLKGSVEGMVTSEQGAGVEGIPVALDGGPPVYTGRDGWFHMDDVPEGARRVAIATSELPAEYDPGTETQAMVVVMPGKTVRARFDVVMAGASLNGAVAGPADAALENIVIRLLPVGRYTSTARTGSFTFYNVPDGSYEVAVDESTLPAYAVLKTPAKFSVTLRAGQPRSAVRFEFELKPPVKPVRRITLP